MGNRSAPRSVRRRPAVGTPAHTVCLAPHLSEPGYASDAARPAGPVSGIAGLVAALGHPVRCRLLAEAEQTAEANTGSSAARSMSEAFLVGRGRGRMPSALSLRDRLTGRIGRPARERRNSLRLGQGSRRWALPTGWRTSSRSIPSSGGGTSTGCVPRRSRRVVPSSRTSPRLSAQMRDRDCANSNSSSPAVRSRTATSSSFTSRCTSRQRVSTADACEVRIDVVLRVSGEAAALCWQPFQ